MFSHPKVEKVLFISEFDRGIIKEILKHKTVNELFFISDKEKLQEVFEEHFFKREPNVKIVFDNAKEYIENFQNYFDIIIIDSKNPDLDVYKRQVFGGYIATLLSKTAPSNTFLAFRMMVIIFTGVWFSAFLYDYLKHRRRYKNT